MSKQPGSFVLTFSRKNKDALDILNKKITDDTTFVKSDYICDAIKFYNKYGNANKIDNINETFENKEENNNLKLNLELQITIKNTDEGIKKMIKIAKQTGYLEDKDGQ